MSKFTGKCDFYDHLMMRCQIKDGNGYYSDEMECFKDFKEKTKGIIYQNIGKVKVNINNQDLLADNNKFFKVIENKIEVEDKRTKSGFKSKVTYTYIYFGKEMTLKEINNSGGISFIREVRFDTLLDLIPYYPYIIGMCASNKDGEYVEISSESYIETRFKQSLEYGFDRTSTVKIFNKLLQEHYLEVIKNYYDLETGKELPNYEKHYC